MKRNVMGNNFNKFVGAPNEEFDDKKYISIWKLAWDQFIQEYAGITDYHRGKPGVKTASEIINRRDKVELMVREKIESELHFKDSEHVAASDFLIEGGKDD